LHYYLKAVDSEGNEYIGEQVDITVIDNDAPLLIFENSDTSAITGGNFNFNSTFEDNIGIVEVEVYYRFGEGTETSAIMAGTDMAIYSITIPGDSTDPLYYYMVARDAHGNAIQTAQSMVQITDNIPGTISNDQSDSSGKEGEKFKFQIDVLDNVGISEVMVAYWFGDDESEKVYLPLTGVDRTYTGSFNPQKDGTLHYYFVVTDEGGNILEGDENTASIGARPEDEAEGVLIPWMIVVVLIIVILILLFLMMRQRKEEEIPSEVLGLDKPEEEIIEGSDEEDIQKEIEGEEAPEGTETPPEAEVTKEEVIDEDLKPEKEIVRGEEETTSEEVEEESGEDESETEVRKKEEQDIGEPEENSQEDINLPNNT
jgi:hypothetical protein